MTQASLLALQLELAMGLSSTLDLEQLCRETLMTMLRRLELRGAAILRWRQDQLVEVVRIPRAHPVHHAAECAALASQAIDAPEPSIRLKRSVSPTTHEHLFWLPGFGVLVLDKHGDPLDPAAERALEPIAARLAVSARACMDHAQLAQSERRYAALIDHLQGVVFEGRVDASGRWRFDYVSARCQALLDVDPAQLRLDATELWRRLAPDAVEQLLQGLALGQVTRQEQELPTRDGRWLSWSAERVSAPDAQDPIWCGLIQDITPRRELEQLRRQHEQTRTSALLEMILDGVVGADAQGTITHWNQGAQHMLGFSAEQIVGEGLTRIMPTRFQQAHDQGMRHHLSSGQTRILGRPVELTAAHADGHEVPIELLVTRVGAGQDALFIGVMRAIAPRKRARPHDMTVMEYERSLRTTLELLSALSRSDAPSFLSSALEGVTSSLHVTRAILWTSEAPPPRLTQARLCGQPRPQAWPDTLSALDHPDYWAALGQQALLVIIDALRDPRVQTVYGPHGHEHDVASCLHVPVYMGETLTHVLWIESSAWRAWTPSEIALSVEVGALLSEHMKRQARDEVAREHLLQAQEQQERLNLLLASTSAILYAARLPDLRVEYVSDSVMTVLGYTPQQMTAPSFWSDALHPHDQTRVLTELETLWRTGFHIHEYRLRHADGSWRWLHDEVRLIQDPQGAPLRAVGASFDITERRRVEHKLQALLRTQEIIARTSTLFLSANPPSDVSIVEEALGELASQANADRGYIILLREEMLDNTHEWCAQGVSPQKQLLQRLPAQDYEIFLQQMRQDKTVYIPKVSELSAGDMTRQILEAQDIDSLLAVPLFMNHELFGFIGLDNPRNQELEPHELGELLRLFAESVLAGMRRVEDALAMRKLNAQLTQQTSLQQALIHLALHIQRAETREQLFELLRLQLSHRFGWTRISLLERERPWGQTCLLRLLNPHVHLNAPTLEEFAKGQHAQAHLHERQLAGSALEAAITQRQVISTRSSPRERYPDWRALHDVEGLDQFAVIPLLESDGVLGTLNMGRRGDSPSPEDLAGLVQLGTMIATRLTILNAQQELAQLNAQLEQRVRQRTAELAESEARFKELFEQAPQALLILDEQQRVIQANSQGQALLRDLYSEGAAPGFPSQSWPEQPQTRALLSWPAPSGASTQTLDLEVSSVMITRGLPQRIVSLTDVTDRQQSQRALMRSLQEKETLLKEIHHRVKNNLQIISSLLHMQSDRAVASETRQSMRESVYRIQAMALVHEQLYGMESLDAIELGRYIQDLVCSIQSSLMSEAKLTLLTRAPVLTKLEVAIPIGLILNELLTNALKYGSPRGPQPWELRVELNLSGTLVEVSVADQGQGLPPGFELRHAKTLGFQIVSALLRQLRATLDLERLDPGTKMTLRLDTSD